MLHGGYGQGGQIPYFYTEEDIMVDRAQKESFFGWNAQAQNMSYEVRKWPSSDPMKEELRIYDGSKLTNINIPHDLTYSAERILSNDALPFQGTKFDVYKNYGKDRYVVFNGQPPCAPTYYKQDLCGKKGAERDKSSSCNPISGYTCGTPQGVYYGEKGNRIAGDFMWAANKAARYYSDFFNIRLAQGKVGFHKLYVIDGESGEVKEKRTAVFSAGGLRFKWYDWRKAQKCDRYVKEGKFLFACYEYDKKLVGTKEPPTAIDEISIVDKNNDGRTDSVEVWWARAPGRFDVQMRSAYTEGLLEYFDGAWHRYGNDSFRYRTPSAPLDLKVKQGDRVCRGQALFTYRTNKGIKTFRAEVDGVVKYLSNRDGLCLDIEKKELPWFLGG
jgi:hypothetical protein